MTTEFSGFLRQKDREEEQRMNRRWKIRGAVFLLHALLVGIPLLWGVLDKFFSPPKVNAFRVKIGPKELSHSPVVGQPERARPGSAPAEPQVSVPAPEPKVVVPPKRPRPKPAVKKPVKKQVKKAIRKPVRRAEKKTARKTVRRPVRRPKRDLQAEVYRPPAGTNELRAPGHGRNFNRNVPIGTRDRGQVQGKADHRTPGGGLSEKMEQFNRRAGMYLKNIWIQPPKSLLGSSLPAVTIEIALAADGRVLGKRIIKSSGVQAMDESVRILLERLDRMPAPPKNTVIQFILQTDD